jgi:hypothetical protein
MTMTAPVAVVDVLASLLEAEQASVFRFMSEGSPYLSRASAEIRRPLGAMVDATERRIADLGYALDSLGVVPPSMSHVRPEDQYLAYLSLKFLLPKLVTEKQVMVQRYQNALGALSDEASSEVRALLEAHLAELKREEAILEHAAASIVPAKNSAGAIAPK